MDCSRCGFDNPPTNNYCENCRLPLSSSNLPPQPPSHSQGKLAKWMPIVAIIAIILAIVAVVYIMGIVKPGLPVIYAFTTSPNSMSAGGTSTLSWSVSNANTVNIVPGVGNVAATGSMSVMPSSTTIYTISAVNANGSTNATTQVIVNQTPVYNMGNVDTQPPIGLPLINEFSASPTSVSAGGTSTLSWSVSNANTVNIQPGIGNVAASGSTTVAPSSTTTYTISAVSSNGSTNATTQIQVATIPLTYIHLNPGDAAKVTANDFVCGDIRINTKPFHDTTDKTGLIVDFRDSAYIYAEWGADVVTPTNIADKPALIKQRQREESQRNNNNRIDIIVFTGNQTQPQR